MKRIISALTILTLLISLFPAVSASSENTTGKPYVAYLNGNLTNNLGNVYGNVYTANGDVSLNLSRDDRITGNIYYQKDHNFTMNMDFKGSPMPLDTTSFVAEPIDIPDVPTISKYVESYQTTQTDRTISESTHFGSLSIEYELCVDTSKGIVSIVVDNLNMNNGPIYVSGNGALFLYSNSPIILNGKISSANPGNIHIIAPSFEFPETEHLCSINANLYQRSDSSIMLTNGTVIKGNVITASKIISLSNYSIIYGVVYAPDADIELSKGSICGRVVANNLNINYGGGISITDTYDDLIIPNIYNLNISISPEGAGTVTPSGGRYFTYAKVQLNVAPNKGYEFVCFNSDSAVCPDKNNIIKMSSPINLTAKFDKMGDPPVFGDPIVLDYSYAYLYGYDDDTGRVGPEDAVTREQASALIFRLLKQNGLLSFTAPASPSFCDIKPDRWSYLALEYMTSIRVFDSTNRRVSPELDIPRGEAAKIISIALNIAPDYSKPDSLSIFRDMVKSDPYYYYIKALYDNGYLQGAGNFMMPDSTLTRAQVVTIINRIIGRDDRYDISSITEPPYTDISPSDWYYKDIVRASNGFTDTPDPSDNLYKIDPSKKVPREQIDY